MSVAVDLPPTSIMFGAKPAPIRQLEINTPVRFFMYPWIATVIQGQIDSFEGVSISHRNNRVITLKYTYSECNGKRYA